MSGLGTSPGAIEYQYDVGNDFFARWLDETMSYSCALWADEPELDLVDAQRKKIDHHVREARAAGADRVLDVGCGWGGVLRRLTSVHGVERAVGLTLSPQQHAHIAAWAEPAIDVVHTAWQDYEPTEPFDAIISLGAFEHFARPDLDRDAKVDAYRAFFATCHDWLRPGRYLSLQTMALEDVDEVFLDRFERYGDRFIPQSTAPFFEEIALAAADWFDVRAVRCEGQEYARTMHLWLAGLKAARRAIVDEYGIELYKRFRQTLRGAQTMFELRQLTLYRITLQQRPRQGRPLGHRARS